MNQCFTCRVSQSADLPELSLLFDEYRQFYLCKSDKLAAYTWLETNQKTGGSTVFVAESDRKLLGFTQLYPALCSVDLVKYYILYDLFVAEKARRMGVARALMKTASDWAKTQGAARIDLETARDNEKAQALYRSLNYELDEVFIKFSLNLS